ncbi:CoA transferase [Saccharopolyspora erythraea]|uniref:CoA transferase n=1 Tax=Saccharopolyspora erythraea TaxID=1836 RepID=UPI001BA52140|nr:CoA transferase [Saccharopolyspora erythraea]QUH04203.1 CoA transferase [Saccharopolyspora erythraea]
MTTTASVPKAVPEVAARVAQAQLTALPADCAAAQVEADIDWSGPVGIPLPDESAVQAACGLMHVHGRAAGRPARLGVDYASTVAGVLAAQGVLAGSIACARGTRLSSVRTSVAQAALLAVQQYLAVATSDDEWVESWEAGGRPPFRSRDGTRFELETLHAEGWQLFWRELGAEPSAIAEGWWPFQQRFATASASLPLELHKTLAAVDYEVVTAAAASAGIHAVPLRDDPAHPVDVDACSLRMLPGTGEIPPSASLAKPLEGIVVVESTRRVQGPVAGHVLQMLGAEVIRIEPPGGDPMRGIPPMAGDCSARFRALNEGKRLVELDFKTDAGRRAVHELVAAADVFVHNWAPGKAEQLGLDAADLARTSPGLTYAWASGWEPLPWPDKPVGTDFLVQAHSGLGAAVYPEDEPSAPSLMTLTDILGGLVCAQGVLASLLRRVRTNTGSRVDSSLYSAAGVVPRSRRRPLWTELDRPLATGDGFLVLPRGVAPSCVAGPLGLRSDGGTAEIVARVREQSTATLISLLAEADVVATQVCTDLRDLAADPRFGIALVHDKHVFPSTPWEFK